MTSTGGGTIERSIPRDNVELTEAWVQYPGVPAESVQDGAQPPTGGRA